MIILPLHNNLLLVPCFVEFTTFFFGAPARYVRLHRPADYTDFEADSLSDFWREWVVVMQASDTNNLTLVARGEPPST